MRFHEHRVELPVTYEQPVAVAVAIAIAVAVVVALPVGVAIAVAVVVAVAAQKGFCSFLLEWPIGLVHQGPLF